MCSKGRKRPKLRPCALCTQEPARDGLRQGVRWQLLDGGAVSSLTSLLHSTSKATCWQRVHCGWCSLLVFLREVRPGFHCLWFLQHTAGSSAPGQHHAGHAHALPGAVQGGCACKGMPEFIIRAACVPLLACASRMHITTWGQRHGCTSRPENQCRGCTSRPKLSGVDAQAALLGESTMLASLVDFCAALPPHSPLVDVSLAIVNLCDTDSPALQQQVPEPQRTKLKHQQAE